MHFHSIATEFASNSNASTCDLIELTMVQQSLHPSATSVVVSSSSPSKKFEHIALPVHQLELNILYSKQLRFLCTNVTSKSNNIDKITHFLLLQGDGEF
jgi:hypothetical protein